MNSRVDRIGRTDCTFHLADNGNGYMGEYAIGKLYTRARVARVYGGTSEIMKIIVGREVLSEEYITFY